MNTLTIPNVDDAVLQRLKQRAWQCGLPLEESLRRLLAETVAQTRPCRQTREAPWAAER